MITIERVPQLPNKSIVNGLHKIIIYDPSDDKTYRTDLSNIFSAQGLITYEWNPAVTYIIDNIVLYQDNFWISLQNGNLNNVPQENSFWHELSKSQSGLALWQAGVYSEADVYVVADFSGTKILLRLKSSTRPYNSSNILTEYLAGDWEIVGNDGAKFENVNTTSDFALDLKNLPKKYFKGTAAISSDKIITLTNASKAVEFFLKINITTVADITTPAGYLMPNFAPWDSSTRKWTPPSTGKYIFHFLYDGSEGTLEINGGF